MPDVGPLMTLTPTQADDFALYARNPETWIAGARRHFAVAELLFDRALALRTKASQHFDEFSGCHYASYLHAGLAIENAVKAVLIRSDPTVVKLDGSLDRSKLGPKGGHGVKGLVAASLSELSQKEYDLLLKVEEYVIWAGKYAVPMKAEVLYDEAVMNIMRLTYREERDILRVMVNRLLEMANSG